MRRLIGILVIILLLTGCSGASEQMERAITLRSKIQQSAVTFDVALTADYGDEIHIFSMKCQGEPLGELKFTVTEPTSISGISGVIAKGNGKITFDKEVLAFDILADGLVSPISGPWVLLETLRSGYLTSCAQEGELFRVSIDDSYQEKALHLDIWLNESDIPQKCEIFWQGRRLLSMDVKNFSFV